MSKEWPENFEEGKEPEKDELNEDVGKDEIESAVLDPELHKKKQPESPTKEGGASEAVLRAEAAAAELRAHIEEETKRADQNIGGQAIEKKTKEEIGLRMLLGQYESSLRLAQSKKNKKDIAFFDHRVEAIKKKLTSPEGAPQTGIEVREEEEEDSSQEKGRAAGRKIFGSLFERAAKKGARLIDGLKFIGSKRVFSLFQERRTAPARQKLHLIEKQRRDAEEASRREAARGKEEAIARQEQILEARRLAEAGLRERIKAFQQQEEVFEKKRNDIVKDVRERVEPDVRTASEKANEVEGKQKILLANIEEVRALRKRTYDVGLRIQKNLRYDYEDANEKEEDRAFLERVKQELKMCDERIASAERAYRELNARRRAFNRGWNAVLSEWRSAEGLSEESL